MTRKFSDLLWLIFQCARDDRLSFIDAYDGDNNNPNVKQANLDLRDIELMQRRLFGSSETKLDVMMKRGRVVGFSELKRLVETNPELFTWAAQQPRAVDAATAASNSDKKQ